MEATVIHLGIYFNDKHVKETAKRGMNRTFEVNFHDSTTMQIQQWPEEIKILIQEKGPMGHQEIGQLFVGIPELARQANALDAKATWIPFSGHIYMNGDKADLPTTISGKLQVQVGWGHSESGEILAPPAPREDREVLPPDPMALLAGGGALNVRKFLAWMSDFQTDPNDPRNLDLINKRRGLQYDLLKKADFFRLNSLSRDIQFSV